LLLETLHGQDADSAAAAIPTGRFGNCLSLQYGSIVPALETGIVRIEDVTSPIPSIEM
jgi:hypothetical protein